MAMTFAGGAWKADIDRDYEKRGKKNGRKNVRRVFHN